MDSIGVGADGDGTAGEVLPVDGGGPQAAGKSCGRLRGISEGRAGPITVRVRYVGADR